MNCMTLPQVAPAEAVGGASPVDAQQASATRFADLVNGCNSGSNDTYFDAPAPDKSSAADYPILGMLSQIQNLDVQSTNQRALKESDAGNRYENSDDIPDDESVSYADIMESAVTAQGEILKTVIMLETVNTANKGVTTLFQLQG
jgi:hypothetical protein